MKYTCNMVQRSRRYAQMLPDGAPQGTRNSQDTRTRMTTEQVMKKAKQNPNSFLFCCYGPWADVLNYKIKISLKETIISIVFTPSPRGGP